MILKEFPPGLCGEKTFAKLGFSNNSSPLEGEGWVRGRIISSYFFMNCLPNTNE